MSPGGLGAGFKLKTQGLLCKSIILSHRTHPNNDSQRGKERKFFELVDIRGKRQLVVIKLVHSVFSSIYLDLYCTYFIDLQAKHVLIIF